MGMGWTVGPLTYGENTTLHVVTCDDVEVYRGYDCSKASAIFNRNAPTWPPAWVGWTHATA